jgi:YidC/Oxa1 family membrane protein insertase
MSSLLSGPLGVAYGLVLVLVHVLAPVTGGLATAAAIVVFTMAVRLLLSPLTFYGMRGQASIAAMQPRVQELRARYAKQPERLQAELTALYREHGGGMLGGCLPLLLQLPFFSIMYRLFLSGTIDGRRNSLLSHNLFGAPLGSHWLTGAGPASVHGLVFLGLFALLAVVSLLAVRAARAASPVPAPAGQAGGAMGLLTKVMPFTTVAIAAFVPLAAGLYLLTSASWTAVERSVLRRRVSPMSPMSPVPAVTGDAATLRAGSGRSGPAPRRGGGAAPSAARARAR